MSKKNDEWINELMEEEDQLIEEMREEFRKRLEQRLQKRLEAKEQSMPEVGGLKKKERSDCN
jgi:FKBP-type peptidyl-prolyl cis-trans isomerase (trigger factor)